MTKFCRWRHGHKLWRHNYYLKIHVLRRPRVANFADIIKIRVYLLQKSWNIQKMLKKLKIIYLNEIYICISWYNESCWFPVKKCWCHQNSRDVSRNLYDFGSSSGKFRHCRICMTDLKEGRLFATPICEHSRKGPSWTGLNKTSWDQYREL